MFNIPMVSGCRRRNRPPEFLAYEGSDLTVGAGSGQDAIAGLPNPSWRPTARSRYTPGLWSMR
jgi:hypothetical protein